MIYIKENNKLKEICKEIKDTANIIGIDTEFLRKREYFPTLCLIQVSFFNGKEFKTILIDTLAKNLRLKPFISILQNKKIQKVIHSPIQDIEAFYFISKKIPNSIEDTQLMAEFCGYKHYTGYGNLVKELCGVTLSKSKAIQRSDWSKRPLTKKQILYASNDSKYLIEMYEILKRKLKKEGNFKFYEDEVKRKFHKKLIVSVINDSWKRLRFKLNAKNFLYVSVVKNLCRWREEKAIDNNTIRVNIFSDSAIRSIAKKVPENKTDMKKNFAENKKISELSKADTRGILKCVKNGKRDYCKYRKSVKEETPFYYEPKGTKNIKLYNKIVKFLQNECVKNNIASELVLNKGNIVSVIMNFEKIKDVFYGWKYELFGKNIETILKEKN